MNKRFKWLSRLIAPAKNAMNLSTQFLKYGNKGMRPNWTDVVISDQDLYSGYGYAAIRNRASNVARIASSNVRTVSEIEDLKHPYLEALDRSKFSIYQFWRDISTYLDLEGVYYLMAVRNFNENRVGRVQEFKLLNPYNIKRILDKDKLEVTGYVEAKKGFVREIPKEMIIEIKDLNPFDEDKPFAMTDAAKESQFILKTAGDYTRHSLKHNITAPGIMTTDVVLSDEEFENFVARVRNHTKGEPVFGNGSGSITWSNMQSELNKAALKDVNEINRDALFAVSGVSKTIMGIEQSGTTRETSRVQRELNIENHILPQIQLILDSLNLDYRLRYPNEYQNNKAKLVVDNPLESDHDADLKEIEVFKERLDLYLTLINKGIDKDIASDYVMGEVGLDQIDISEADEIDETENNEEVKEFVKNEVDTEREGIIQQQEGALRNAILNIENQLVMSALGRISKYEKKRKNQVELEDELDLITKTDKKRNINELAMVLATFYGIIFSLRGKEWMDDRKGEFALDGEFSFTKAKERINSLAEKVADSHVNTISEDIFKIARESALAGKSVIEIENDLKNRFAKEISEVRAKTISRTETNRAFTLAQYEADLQFTEQNNLEGRVFKKWRTRSANPCEFCRALANEPAIPIEKNFRSLGDKIVVGEGKNKKELLVDFVDLEAGNAHPNCSCEYELIIENASNSLLIERLEKKYQEADKQSEEAKKLLEEIKKEKAKVKADRKRVKKTIKEIEEVI